MPDFDVLPPTLPRFFALCATHEKHPPATRGMTVEHMADAETEAEAPPPLEAAVLEAPKEDEPMAEL